MSQESKKTKPVRFADLTSEVCPMTFVKVKLHLEQISPGEVLEVVLKGDEAIRDVPRSVKEEGHRIVRVWQEDDKFHLYIRKG